MINIGEHGWLDYKFNANIKALQKYKKKMAQYGYTDLGTEHSISIEAKKEAVETFAELMKSLKEKIVQRGDILYNTEMIERYTKIIHDETAYSGIGPGNTSCMSTMLGYNEELGINNLSEFGVHRFLLNRLGISNGIDGMEIERIATESIYVDEFIKKYYNFEIQGNGIVENDILKANIINSLINQPEFEQKEQAEECLQILIRKINYNLGYYKEYLEKKGFDWMQKQEELDKMLETLGVDCEYIGMNYRVKIYEDSMYKIMRQIEENRDIKYIVKLEKLRKMIKTKIEMEIDGLQDHEHEKNYIELLQKLSEEIDVKYLNELYDKGKLENLKKYLGIFDYTLFSKYLVDRKTMRPLTKEERFQGIKGEIDERIDKMVKSEKEYMQSEEQYYKKVEETKDLYTINEAGKSTIYTNIEKKENVNNKIHVGVREQKEQRLGIEQE